MVLEFMRHIDKITNIIMITQKMSTNISIHEYMHETTQHPFGGAITRSLRFLARLLADNKPAVKIFEMNPDKVNVILSKTVIDFDNPLMQENAILCI